MTADRAPDPWTKQPGDYRTSLGARVARALRNQAWAGTLLAWLAARYVRLVWLTSRKTVSGQAPGQAILDAGGSFVGCFWHGRMQLIPGIWRGRAQAAMLISPHRDGRFISDTIRFLGIPTIAGSTSRGGTEALRQIVRALREGTVVGVTPDGPRGPRMHMTVGALVAAKIAGVPILPASWSSSLAIAAGTWDRHLIPLPFGRVVAMIGAPVAIPADADAAALERLRAEIETQLNDLTAACDRAVGRVPIAPAPLP